MSIRNAAVAIALWSIIACSGDGPTQLADSSLQVQAPLLSQGATGAIPGADDFDLVAYDLDGDGTVCIKTVPAGKGKPTPRTIIMDNKDRECPGGFEAVTIEEPGEEEPGGPEEPCELGGTAIGCDCEAAGGIEFGGICHPAG